MGKLMLLKAIINKKNGQINVAIPRRKLSMIDAASIEKSKIVRMFFDGVE